MALAAIRVKGGEIVQRAGRASGVSITPTEGGFLLHGAKGPPPDGWVQSPDTMILGWEQQPNGIQIWTDHPEPTIRFVPDVVPGADEEPLPEPDWSRVLTIEQAVDRAGQSRALAKAEELVARKVIEDIVTNLDKDDALSVAPLFPAWEPEQLYREGKVLRYQGGLLRVVQEHTSQADWLPEDTPALYTAYWLPDDVPDWVQPTGAHDAYSLGARVRHDGQCWESQINANTTEPGSDDRWWEEFPCPDEE